MGEDTHSPTVGLVVPVVGLDDDEVIAALSPEERAEVLNARRVRNEFFTSDEVRTMPVPLVPRMHGKQRSRGPGKGRIADAVHLLTIAIQALQNAREGADALRPGMLQHQRDAVLCDPISQINLARRSLDAVERRWKRGGV